MTRTAEQIAEKCCGRCGSWKPLEAFEPHNRSRDGRITVCRVCREQEAPKRVNWREELRHIKPEIPAQVSAGEAEMAAARSRGGIARQHGQAQPQAQMGERIRAKVRSMVEEETRELIEERASDIAESVFMRRLAELEPTKPVLYALFSKLPAIKDQRWPREWCVRWLKSVESAVRMELLIEEDLAQEISRRLGA